MFIRLKTITSRAESSKFWPREKLESAIMGRDRHSGGSSRYVVCINYCNFTKNTCGDVFEK